MMIQTLILMLIVLSALTFFTGAKTAVVPMKLCPLVTAIVTVLFGYGVISA
jgi:uncharacterized membrane protein